MRSAPLLAIGLVSVLSGCAPKEPTTPPKPAAAAPSAKPAAPAKAPFDFEALLRREAPVLPVKKLAGEVLTADVESAGELQTVTEKGSLHVKIPIGTQGPIDCYVYDEPKDGAATLALIVDEMKKSLEVRLFAPTDVYVAGEHAVLAARSLYLQDTDGVKGAGEIKLAFLNSPDAPSLCVHDEPGYTATFKRIAKRFFETVKRRDRELRGNAASSWEVSVTKLDGIAVGFDERRTYDHTGTKVSTSVSVSSTLYPRSAIDCRPEDSVTTRTTAEPSGELLELSYVKGSRLDIEMKVDLKRVSPASYTFTGEQSGKAISGKFKTKDKAGIATDPIISGNIKKLLAGKANAFKLEEYAPSIDATAAIETSYELDSKDDRRVRISFGPIKLTAVADADGQAEKVSANLGRSTLTIERLAHGKR